MVFKTFIFCMYVGMIIHGYRVQRARCENQFFHYTMSILGTELGSSGLAASAYDTHSVIFPVPKVYIIYIIIQYIYIYPQDTHREYVLIIFSNIC